VNAIYQVHQLSLVQWFVNYHTIDVPVRANLTPGKDRVRFIAGADWKVSERISVRAEPTWRYCVSPNHDVGIADYLWNT
jgi:hypothetical protein